MPPMSEPERLRRPEDEAEDRDGQGLFRRADHGDVAVAPQQVDVGVDVVLGGNRVEDEVEAAGVLGHLIGVAGENDFIRAEAQRVFLLAFRGGEDDGVRSKGVREFDAHVAESADADNAHLLAFGYAPVTHRRISGNAGAEQRRGSGEIQVGGHMQHEVLFDNDAV